MREEARHLLHEAIAAHGVAATARRLGVARASLSLLYHDKYPGSTARMEERILRVLASPCPVYGGPWGQDICAGRRATPMPTSKTMPCTSARVNHEAGCLLLVQRTAGRIVRPLLL